MKIKRGMSFFLGVGLLLVSAATAVTPKAFAEPAEGPVEISDSDTFNDAFYYGGNYILTVDLDYNSKWGAQINAVNDTTIDLNGHTVIFDQDAETIVTRGGNITIKGEGEIRKTTESGEIPALWAYKMDNEAAKTITVEGGKISAINYAVTVKNGASFVLKGGEISATNWAITGYTDAEVAINGGRVVADGFALTGQGLEKNANARFYVNGGEVISNNSFAIYQPQVNGLLEVTGGEVTGAAGAIAVNRGEVTVSGGKLTSRGVDLDGGATQDGVAGYKSAVIATTKEYGNVTVTVTGGEFVGEGEAKMIADTSGLDNENVATVEISGGKFSVMPEAEQVKSGYDVYAIDDGFIVDEQATVSEFDKVTLLQGETYAVELNDNAKYAKLTVDDSGIVTVSGMNLVAGETAGEASYYVNYGGLVHPMTSTYKVVVSEIEAKVEANVEEGEEAETNAFIAEQLMELVRSVGDPDVSNEYIYINSYGNLKGYLMDGETFTVKVEENEVDWEEAKEFHEKLAAKVGESNVASAAEIWMGIYVDDSQQGTVYKLRNPITLRIAIPEGYRTAPEGYERKFSVVREHYNAVSGEYEADTLETEFDGENAVVKNDKFSTFVVTYKDEKKVETPDTGAFTKVTEDFAVKNRKLGVWMLACGMIMLGCGLVSLGKRYQEALRKR